MQDPYIHTFVCRAPSGSSLMMDVRTGDDAISPQDHARRLLADHPTSAYVEVWLDEKLVELVRRPASSPVEQGAV
jgi:hypothetical protein